MKIRSMLRRRRQPVGQIDPDPLRTPDEAFETGFIIGATGNQKTPWVGVAIKNLKDRRIATGDSDDRPVGPAGEVSGTRPGEPGP